VVLGEEIVLPVRVVGFERRGGLEVGQQPRLCLDA
jgi:hypothetical protein